MITESDVEILNKIFVTKHEWQEQNIVISNEFKGLIQLLGEMEERLIARMDEKFDRQDEKLDRQDEKLATALKEIKQQFKEVQERNREQDEKFDQHVKESNKKFYNLLEKMNDQYAILLNQEKRLAKTEHKLFPTP